MTTNNSANQNTTGLQSLTTGGVFNGRTLTGTANQVAVANGDGTGGNPTLSLTSSIYVTGISFDSGSNTLSSYVEGSFTPTLTNTGSAPTVGYTNQIGNYTRIGNRVIASIQIDLSSYTAGSGNVQISSLPITSANVANHNHVASLRLVSTTFGASVIWYVALLGPNSTSATLVGMRSAATALSLDASGPSASSQIYTTIVYEV